MWTALRALTDGENLESWAVAVEKEIEEKAEELGAKVTNALRSWYSTTFTHATTMKTFDMLFDELKEIKQVSQNFISFSLVGPGPETEQKVFFCFMFAPGQNNILQRWLDGAK